MGDVKPGKFNFGVGMRGVEMNLVDMDVWRRIDCCLGPVWSLLHRCH